MPRFSTFFRLNASQSQLDFIDVDTDEDVALYVDPYAIETRNDAWSARASESIRGFFLEVLDSLRAGDRARAASLMSNLREPKETFLGVSAGRPQGRGVGQRQAEALVRAIENSKAFQTGLLTDLSEMALYVEGIDRDKISDLTTNIIRHHLVEYTLEQCNLFGIAVEQYNGPPLWDDLRKNWVAQIVNLPKVNDDSVLLVPKYICRRVLSLNSSEFYSKQITDFLVAEQLKANSSLVQTLATGKKKVFKTAVREKYPKSKTFISDLVSDHPELLDYYKRMAREKMAPVNVRDDDATIGRVCVELSERLKATPTGAAAANDYHIISMGIITTCFYPDLIQPRKEWEINDGRKRIDVVYTNAADSGFFSHRRDANNTEATMVIVECKNYSNDINNPEVDQLLGRFDRNRGRFGIIACRNIVDEDLILDRCRDAARAGTGFILVLTDEDLSALLKFRAIDNIEAIHGLLQEKFAALIA